MCTLLNITTDTGMGLVHSILLHTAPPRMKTGLEAEAGGEHLLSVQKLL